jgi:hypothetical protein
MLCNSVRAYQICILKQVECFSNSLLSQHGVGYRKGVFIMDQANFKFYQANKVYGALFFQFPKVLMYGEQYRYLSSEAKLAYMVLKDRLEYSLRNHWVDEEGHVYFIFTNQELMYLFNCSKGKLANVKKELEKAGFTLSKSYAF